MVLNELLGGGKNGDLSYKVFKGNANSDTYIHIYAHTQEYTFLVIFSNISPQVAYP